MADTAISNLPAATSVDGTVQVPCVQGGVTKVATLSVVQEDIVQIFKRTVELTDAQIKALPTTPVEIVPAPGAGKIVRLLNGFMAMDFRGGTYLTSESGEITSANMYLKTGGGTQVSLYVADPSWIFADDSDVWSGDFLPNIYVNAGALFGDGGYTVAEMTNQPMTLHLDPNIIADLTGGNAANTLKITVVYTIIDV